MSTCECGRTPDPGGCEDTGCSFTSKGHCRCCAECDRHVETTREPAAPVSSSSGSEAGDLSGWMKTPHKIAVDAKGYVWRAYTEESYWSMAPTNPDNSPVPTPITYYVPESEVVAAVTAERERADAGWKEAEIEDLKGDLFQARHLSGCYERLRDEWMARAVAAESELAGLRERIEALEPLFVQPQQPDDNGDRDFALGYNEALREVLRALGSATKTGEGT